LAFVARESTHCEIEDEIDGNAVRIEIHSGWYNTVTDYGGCDYKLSR
jgi:hypothetical protein